MRESKGRIEAKDINESSRVSGRVRQHLLGSQAESRKDWVFMRVLRSAQEALGIHNWPRRLT